MLRGCHLEMFTFIFGCFVSEGDETMKQSLGPGVLIHMAPLSPESWDLGDGQCIYSEKDSSGQREAVKRVPWRKGHDSGGLGLNSLLSSSLAFEGLFVHSGLCQMRGD